MVGKSTARQLLLNRTEARLGIRRAGGGGGAIIWKLEEEFWGNALVTCVGGLSLRHVMIIKMSQF